MISFSKDIHLGNEKSTLKSQRHEKHIILCKRENTHCRDCFFWPWIANVMNCVYRQIIAQIRITMIWGSSLKTFNNSWFHAFFEWKSTGFPNFLLWILKIYVLSHFVSSNARSMSQVKYLKYYYADCSYPSYSLAKSPNKSCEFEIDGFILLMPFLGQVDWLNLRKYHRIHK